MPVTTAPAAGDAIETLGGVASVWPATSRVSRRLRTAVTANARQTTRRGARVLAAMGLLLNAEDPHDPTNRIPHPSVTRLSGDDLTRGFASPPHDGFAFVGRGTPLLPRKSKGE